MRRLLLIASAIMMVLAAFSTNAPASASGDVAEQAPLSVALAAAGHVDRAYSWGLEKVADTTIRSTNSTGTATFRYTVTARAGAMKESGWELTGEVTVTNPNDGEWDAITADVAVVTTLGGGSACAVVGGAGAVVPPSGQVTLPYACSFTSEPAGEGSVEAAASWVPAGEGSTSSGSATTPVTFGVGSETNKTVTVVDDKTVRGQRVVLGPAVTWSPGLVKTYTYDLAVPGGAPGRCIPYVNNATLDQSVGADPSASATVQACTPEVLPAQAFGQATGSVRASCQGTLRTRVSNRTAETVTYLLRVGPKVHRITVRSLSHKKFVTRGRARAKVTLKVGGVRLDRIRIPQRCAPPVVLPDTGLRPTDG